MTRTQKHNRIDAKHKSTRIDTHKYVYTKNTNTRTEATTHRQIQTTRKHTPVKGALEKCPRRQ